MKCRKAIFIGKKKISKFKRSEWDTYTSSEIRQYTREQTGQRFGKHKLYKLHKTNGRQRWEKQPAEMNISKVRGMDIAVISLYELPPCSKSIDTS